MTARYSCRTVLFLFLVLGAVVCGRAGWWGDDDDGHDHSHEEELSLGQNYVTCGSLLKLRHVSTSVRLHSHQVSYGSGSGQQSVTGIDSRDDPSSFWIVRGAHEQRCLQGEPIKDGAVIRLQHAVTRLNLHSHGHASPLSKQQEVSCFGPDGDGDESDNWVVETGGDPIWLRSKAVYLRHQVTGMYLHSHDVKYKHPIAGQQEVTCVSKKSAACRWATEEGIYFPERESKNDSGDKKTE